MIIPLPKKMHPIFRKARRIGSTRVEPIPFGDKLRMFEEIISHYNSGRKTYPVAHKLLSQKEDVMWRKLQSGVFLNPQLHSKWHPEAFTPKYIQCNSNADLVCMVLTFPSYNDPNRHVESWEMLLFNHKAEGQRKVTVLALTAAESEGIPAHG